MDGALGSLPASAKPSLSNHVLDQLNHHIVAELEATLVYLAMSAWFDAQGLRGFSKWLSHQSKEEHAHVMKYFEHVLDRGGRLNIGPVTPPKVQAWSSPLAAFEDAMALEQGTTARIHSLASEALNIHDHATYEFLQWFIKEQVEEEDSIRTTCERLSLANGDGAALLLLDREAAERK